MTAWSNAYAERWVRTVRSECLDWTLIWNQQHLHHVLTQYLRHYDTLTELPNRLMLTEQLNLSLQNARLRKTRVALLIIDIDRFKLINDSFGQAAGDLLLQAFARRLTASLRGRAGRSAAGCRSTAA